MLLVPLYRWENRSSEQSYITSHWVSLVYIGLSQTKQNQTQFKCSLISQITQISMALKYSNCIFNCAASKVETYFLSSQVLSISCCNTFYGLHLRRQLWTSMKDINTHGFIFVWEAVIDFMFDCSLPEMKTAVTQLHTGGKAQEKTQEWKRIST